MKTSMILLLTALLGFGTTLGGGEEAPEPVSPSSPDLPPVVREELSRASSGPEIVPLGEERYRIGDLLIDQGARELHFKGRFATRNSPLEYLACAPEGKLYESLLEWDVDPYHLHLGLLLISLEPLNNLENQGDPKIATGDPVAIEVSWEVQGKRVRHRAEELIWNRKRNAPMVRTDWVFTGSLFVDGMFMAAVERSLAAVYNDPMAILNVPLAAGADDTSFIPHEGLVPEVGTEIEVIVRAAATGTDGR